VVSHATDRRRGISFLVPFYGASCLALFGPFLSFFRSFRFCLFFPVVSLALLAWPLWVPHLMAAVSAIILDYLRNPGDGDANCHIAVLFCFASHHPASPPFI